MLSPRPPGTRLHVYCAEVSASPLNAGRVSSNFANSHSCAFCDERLTKYKLCNSTHKPRSNSSSTASKDDSLTLTRGQTCHPLPRYGPSFLSPRGFSIPTARQFWSIFATCSPLRILTQGGCRPVTSMCVRYFRWSPRYPRQASFVV